MVAPLRGRWPPALLWLAVGLGAAAAQTPWAEPERLAGDGGRPSLGLNFARPIAAAADGSSHVVWYEGGEVPSVHHRRLSAGGPAEGAVTELSGAGGGAQPSLLVVADRVLVVWHSPGSEGGLWLRESGDRGESWSPPVQVTPSRAAVHGSLAAAGGVFHLVWADSRSGEAEVFYRRSGDGDDWGEEVRLSAAGADSWTPSIAASPDLVAVAWVETGDGNEEEYVRISRDRGETWQPAQRLTNDVMNSWAPSLAVAGRDVHLAWFDQRDNEFRLADAEALLDQAMRLVGLEPEPAPQGVMVPDPRDPGRRTFYSRAFQARVHEKSGLLGAAVPGWVEAGGDPARVASLMGEFNRRMWIASREWEIYYRRSADAGRSWEPTLRLSEAEGESARPHLAAAGDALHLVWADDRYGDTEVFYRASGDGGATWSVEERLTEAPGASEAPMVAAAPGGLVHVVWIDERSGRAELLHAWRRVGE